MKRLFMLFIFVLLSLVFIACSQTDMDSNTISAGELTDRENAILSTTSDKSFVFDFNMDSSEYEEIAVWIEKYESGHLIDDRLGYITTTTQDEQSGSIIFTISKNDNEQQNIFHIGIGTDGSTASMNGVDTDIIDLEKMASVWGNMEEEKALGNGEVVLANICYSLDEDGMRSLPTDFYEDAAGHINELEAYDVAYLLKAEFIK